MSRNCTFTTLAVSAAPKDTISSTKPHGFVTVPLNPCKSDPQTLKLAIRERMSSRVVALGIPPGEIFFVEHDWRGTSSGQVERGSLARTSRYEFFEFPFDGTRGQFAESSPGNHHRGWE